MTGKNYFFNTFNMFILLACLLLQVKGYAQPACTSTTINGFLPATGPAGTMVTITGTGFSLGAGTTAVQFNGISAVFTAVSDTQVNATVPAGYVTGNITVTTNGCVANRAGFTSITSLCMPEIYISEIYDNDGGSYGVIELYNPAPVEVVFDGHYVLERYGTIGDAAPSTGYTLVLPNSIGSESTYQVVSNNGSPIACGGTRDAGMGSGINGSDQFKLRKDGEIIDVANAPTSAGYTVKRRPNVVAPKINQTNADWIFSSPTCTDIGEHDPGNTTVTNPVITNHPDSITLCDSQPTVSFSVTVSNTTGATYQWKMLNASGVWVNVSGATSATLTVTVPPAPFTGQYYCVITTPNCTLISDAAQLTVNSRPQATYVVSDISCTANTGTITLTPTAGTGLTYSLDGGAYQTAAVFTNVASGTHTVTIKNAEGCTTDITGIQITIPAIPAATIAPIIQPDCTNINGTLTVTSPLGTEYEYSVDGVTFQSGVTFTLPQGSYPITVRNTLTGCTSVSTPVVINAAPLAPAVATATTIDPTCTNINGTLTVTAPLGTEYEYSVDGVTFQSSITFTLPQGSYPITVRNTLTGCTSVSTPVVINAAPLAPAVATATTIDPTCTNINGSLTITTPLGTEYEYSVDGITFQSGITFTLPQGSYPITVRNTLTGCTSVAAPVVINAAPLAPAVATATTIHPTCTNINGSLTVTAPLGTEYEYSVDGITFQSGVTFTLPQGSYPITVRNTLTGCTSVAAPVVINAAPLAPAVATATTIDPTCTNINGSLTVTAPLGTEYEYSVDGVTFQSGVTFTLPQGSYPITVRNTLTGCTSVSTPVVINAAPLAPVVATATTIDPTCTNINGTLTVTAPLGSEYEYSVDGTTFQSGVTFTLPQGSYPITVRNTLTGCTSVAAPVVINAAPLAPALATATTIDPTCTNINGSLTITTPLGSEYEYSVDGVTFQSGLTFTLPQGSYPITVRNTITGCTSVAAPVVINAAPLAPAVATATTIDPTCTNINGTLTITAPLGSEYEYSVDGTTFQSGITFTLPQGSYPITVRNTITGCTSVAAPVVINAAPVAPAAATASVTAQPTCANPNGTITITAPTGTGYEYSSDGINFRTNTTLTLPSGSYTITVRNAAGCTTASGPYTINPAPAAPAVPVAFVLQPDCFNVTGIITITSPTGTGYEYSLDGSSFQASATFAEPEGSYTVTVRNAAGCTSVSASPVVVNPQPATPTVPEITVTLPTCTNINGTLTVTAPVGTGYEYSLDGVNFQASVTFTEPQGSYTVTVRNATGCTATSGTITIGAPQTGLPELGGLQECRPTLNGNNYILEGIAINNSFDAATANFEWRLAGQTAVLSTDTTFNVTEYKKDNNLTSASFPLVFELTITTPGGCTDTYTFTVVSVVCDIPKGISPNNDTRNDTFDLAGMDVINLTIVNRYGMEVYHRRNYSNEWYGQTDNGQELPTGTYFYVVEMVGETRTGWVYLQRDVR